MCGILGYLNKKTDAGVFLNALNSMSHRGPDGYGTWQNDTVYLGHRRLAIIDVTDSGKQPMSAFNRYVIVFNGEIYNFSELRKELILKGIQFKTQSDTEVLLQAYITWGVDCLNKLNGMWAFAIWDDHEKTLFLSRDRLGKKPLFYSQADRAFIFSSEMKGIYPFLPSVEVDREVAEAAITDSFSYESTEKCLINGIKRFPAGNYGIYSQSEGLKIRPYWKPLEQVIKVSRNYGDQVEQFRELFHDACRLRMQSDVTIGTALSGGLDSSAVICSMANVSKQRGFSFQKDWQHAFVACFPGTSLDETEYAKQVTDHLGIPACFINIDPVTELNDIYKQAYLFEEIYYAPTIPFVQLYRNIRKNGVKVSIDGHGADELFGGYPLDMNYSLIDAMPNPFKLKKIFRAIENTRGEKINDKRNYLKFALKNKFPALSKFTSNREIFKKENGLDFLNTQLYHSTFHTILPTLLRNYDRYSMMNGLEIRMPFLDHRLVEFAFHIPYHSKIKNGYSKAIVRDALKDLVPKNILYRKKKIGFNSPMNTWMKAEMKVWLSDTVSSQDFINSNLINGKEVKTNILSMLGKKELTYQEGEKSFSQIMPFIWEKSLKLRNE